MRARRSGLGQDPLGLSAEPLDRDHQGMPAALPGLLRVGDEHLGGGVTLRGLSDYQGDELVTRFMTLIDRRKPLHVSIVGGEPLVRYRELGHPAPAFRARHSHTARHERRAPDPG